MAVATPNTICKNTLCTKGTDGGRKRYYTCRYCVASGNWRSVACSPECYDAYCRQVMEARTKNIDIDLTPDRTDMSKDEVRQLIDSEDTEAVIQESREELADVFEEHPSMGFADAVDLVNEQLDAKKKGGSLRKQKK